MAKARRKLTIEEIAEGLSFFNPEEFEEAKRRGKKVDYLVIHCSATRSTQDISIEDITRWHTDPPPKGRGWSAVGYQVYIKFDGSVHFGRDLDGDGFVLEETGAHVKGYNKRSIGICLEGGYNGEYNFTPRQMDVLELVLAELKAEYPEAKVRGHRDFGVPKSCPSFEVLDYCNERGIDAK